MDSVTTDIRYEDKLWDGRFIRMYEDNAHKIYNLALRMCGNREDAVDIVQDTFLQAYLKLEDFREECSEFTWLYAIAKNLCLKLLQKRKRSSFEKMEELLDIAHKEEPVNIYSEYEKSNLIGQVKDGCLLGLVRCLSFYQRMAFILHVLLDLTITDTSAILGRSEAATRTLVCRAKHNIKSFLCNNCSLYAAQNPCRCENMIEFSLKNSWIHRAEPGRTENSVRITSAEVLDEINGVKRLVRLYGSVKETPIPDSVFRDIRKLIASDTGSIFSKRKVK